MIVQVEHSSGAVAAGFMLHVARSGGIGDAPVLQAVQVEAVVERDRPGLDRVGHHPLPG